MELLRQTLNKELSIDNFLYIIESIFKDHPIFLNTCLVEAIWLQGCVMEKRNENVQETNEMTGVYSTLVNSLIQRRVILVSSLLEKLDESALMDCGLIPDKKVFRTKITRINTKITYEQQKFNLLREESEGFSKLIFLLYYIVERLLEYLNQIKLIIV